MSPGRLDGLYVVVVDAGGASARVRSIDPWVTKCDVAIDGALRSCSEPQGARATSSRGPVSVCTVRIYAYPAHGVAGPVTGAYTGDWDGHVEKLHLGGEVVGKAKGVND